MPQKLYKCSVISCARNIYQGQHVRWARGKFKEQLDKYCDMMQENKIAPDAPVCDKCRRTVMNCLKSDAVRNDRHGGEENNHRDHDGDVIQNHADNGPSNHQNEEPSIDQPSQVDNYLEPSTSGGDNSRTCATENNAESALKHSGSQNNTAHVRCCSTKGLEAQPENSSPASPQPGTSRQLRQEKTRKRKRSPEALEYECSEKDPLRCVEVAYSEQSCSEPISGKIQLRKPPESLYLKNVLGTPRTESSCVVCKSTCGRKIVPQSAVQDLLVHKAVFVHSRARSCEDHIENGVFTAEAKNLIMSSVKKGVGVTAKDVEEMISQLRNPPPRKVINVESLTADEDFKLLFGITRDQFNNLFSSIAEHLRDTVHRSAKNALAVFLAKLRLGLSQRLLGHLFGISDQRKVCQTLARVSFLLERLFVPHHLGYGHISREEILSNHHPEYIQKLYNVSPRCISLYLDATYLFVQKSKNHRLQKKTYSMHKYRNLLKVMMVVLPTGYILDADGMYFADHHNNDASILKDMLCKPGGLKAFTRKRDNFVVDRGFRDSIDALKKEGMMVSMPHCLQDYAKRPPQASTSNTSGTNQNVKTKSNVKAAGNSKSGTRKQPQKKLDTGPATQKKITPKQFTSTQANEFRIVTMTRWIVESVNERIKSVFRFFDHVIPCRYYIRNCHKKLARYFRIACAISNAFFGPLFTENHGHKKLLEEVKTRKNQQNTLQRDIKDWKWDTRRVVWMDCADVSVDDFPSLTLEDLWRITLGDFQIKNAAGYTNDHFSNNSVYKIQVNKEEKGYLRARLTSKFRSSTIHNVYIQYTDDAIPRYYCTCKVGARTLGCCSHITSLLWYFGYRSRIQPPFQAVSLGTDILDAAEKRAGEGANCESESDDDGLLDDE